MNRLRPSPRKRKGPGLIDNVSPGRRLLRHTGYVRPSYPMNKGFTLDQNTITSFIGLFKLGMVSFSLRHHDKKFYGR